MCKRKIVFFCVCVVFGGVCGVCRVVCVWVYLGVLVLDCGCAVLGLCSFVFFRYFFFFFFIFFFFFLMIRLPPRSTPVYSSAASDEYKGQGIWYIFNPLG